MVNSRASLNKAAARGARSMGFAMRLSSRAFICISACVISRGRLGVGRAARVRCGLQSFAAECRGGLLSARLPLFRAREVGVGIDSTDALRKVSDQLSWRREPWKKFLARFYLNYTGEQEFLAPQQARLLAAINAHGGVIPAWFSEEYRLRNRRMTKWFNIMTVNTRMLFLFVLLFLGKPTWYFFVDLTLLNFVLALVLVRQNRMSGDLLVELESRSS